MNDEAEGVSEKKTYFVKVDVSIPLAVPVQAGSADEAKVVGEMRAREIIQKYMPASTTRKAVQYVATEVVPARSPRDAEA